MRVFISSPDDVRPERLVAERIVARLDRDFACHFRVETVLWEREPLVASHHFQDPRNIPPPHSADIVVVILWSRLGTTLSEDQFRGALSGHPVTGTEWEFEDALAGARERGVPHLLLYKKDADPVSGLRDRALVAERLAQIERVEEFFARWLRTVDGESFAAAFTTFTATAEFERLLSDHLLELLQRRAGAVAEGGEIRWHQPPFRGLLSFEFEHAPVFFGRTRARNEVRELLARQEGLGRAFVLVLGASGSGKSSLVKAGLLPDLTLRGMIGRVALCRYALLRPSDAAGDPIGALAAAILAETGLPELAGLHCPAERLAGLLREAPAQTALPIEQGLVEAGRREGLTAIAEARLAIVVDQIEELFTAGISREEQRRFVVALDELARCGLVWVVATMRSDFFGRLEDLPELARLAPIEARYLLLPPDDAELGQIISQPAHEAGLRFESDTQKGIGLDDAIREEAAQDRGALPLLSFLLDQLWRLRSAGRVLTFAAYRDLGGLAGALGRRADQVLAAQPEEVRASLPALLRALVTVGAEGRVAARPVRLDRFPEDSPVRRLIDAFTAPAARLLIGDKDATGDRPTIRVAHEALLSHWQPAQRQIAADRADLELVARLEEDAVRCRRAAAADRDALLLPPGIRLAEAEDLMARRHDELDGAVISFIAESSAREASRRTASELARQARLRRTRIAAASLAVLAIAALALGTLAWRSGIAARQEKSAADRQLAEARRSESRFLTARAEEEIARGNFELAGLIARAALPRDMHAQDRPLWPPAVAALVAAHDRDRQRAVMVGHTQDVESAAFSPDGTRVVTASQDGTARIWDAKTGAALAGLRGQRNADRSGIGGSGFVAVFRGHPTTVESAAFDPDGARVVTAPWDDNTARIWNAKTGALLAVLRGHEGGIYTAAFGPDGTQVVTASADGTARLWDAKTGAALAVLRGHTGEVWRAAFSRDGTRVVTASQDNTARLWNAKTGTSLIVFRGHTDVVFGAAFSPDETRIVTASADKTARIWDAKTGDLLAMLRGHEGDVRSAAFSPDGRQVVTASADGTARLWDAKTGAVLAVLRGHQGAVKSAAFSPDGTSVVTASADHTVRIWDVKNGAALAVLRGHADEVVSAAFSPDGTRVVTASADKTARIWDMKADIPLTILRGHEGAVNSAAFSPDGTRVVTASQDGTARLWNATTGSALAVLRGHTLEVWRAAFSPDGTRVVTASMDMTARIWDAKTGAVLAVLRGHQNAVNDAAFSPDGRRVLTASWDKTARIWDAESGAVLAVLRGHKDQVESAAFSPDGMSVVTASLDMTARLWDAKTGASRTVLRGHRGGVIGAAFSPDGRRVVTASWDNTARIWDAKTGAVLAVLRGHEDKVLSAAFSPDATRIVTASLDGTAGIWDAKTGALLMTLRGHRGGVISAAFNPDGTRVVTASADGTARIWKSWPFLTADTIAYASITALRGLTNAERLQLYLPQAKLVEDASRPAAIGDAASQQRLGQLYETGNALPKNLEQALLHYAIATRLFEEAGDETNAASTRARRGSLARALSPASAVRIANEAIDWKPAASGG